MRARKVRHEMRAEAAAEGRPPPRFDVESDDEGESGDEGIGEKG